MARHRLTRKELKEDVFRDTMFQWIHRLYEYRRWIIAGTTVLIVAGLSGLAAYYYHRHVVQQRAQAFYGAEHHLLDPDVAQDARMKESRERFQAFIAEYPSSALTPVAWMYVAQIAWEQHDAAQARAAYQAVLRHDEATSGLKDVARIGLAKLEEAAGNLEQAQTELLEISDQSYEALRDYTLGRIAVERDQPEAARQHFDKVAKNASSGTLSEWARQALDYLP